MANLTHEHPQRNTQKQCFIWSPTRAMAQSCWHIQLTLARLKYSLYQLFLYSYCLPKMTRIDISSWYLNIVSYRIQNLEVKKLRGQGRIGGRPEVMGPWATGRSQIQRLDLTVWRLSGFRDCVASPSSKGGKVRTPHPRAWVRDTLERLEE